MARKPLRWFWSALGRSDRKSRSGRAGAKRSAPWRICARLPLSLERLEDLTLPSAVVFTDRADYGPGQSALVTATGFQTGETVRLNVDLTVPPPGQSFSPWFVTDGGADDLDGVADGTIHTSWLITDQCIGATLLLTVTGRRPA